MGSSEHQIQLGQGNEPNSLEESLKTQETLLILQMHFKRKQLGARWLGQGQQSRGHFEGNGSDYKGSQVF